MSGGARVLALKDEALCLTEFNDSRKCKKLNIGHKTQFTVCEGIQMFEIVSQNSHNNIAAKVSDRRLRSNECCLRGWLNR